MNACVASTEAKMALLKQRLPLLIGREHKRQRQLVNKELYALEHDGDYLLASAELRKRLAVSAKAKNRPMVECSESASRTNAAEVSAAAAGLARLHYRSEVTSCYDSFAPSYEAELARLGYRTPALIGAALARAVSRDAGERDGGQASAKALDHPVLSTLLTLDLGCGTGLSGAVVHGRCHGQLMGCDLSAKMLDVAARKRRVADGGASGARRPLYDALVCMDAVAYLRRVAPASTDLIVACELLVYMRELEDLFAAVRTALVPAGLFAFSVERAEADEVGCPPAGPGWIERPSERMAHTEAYVRRLVEEGGAVEGGCFELLSLDEETLRTDTGTPVCGLVVVVRKSCRTEPSAHTRHSAAPFARAERGLKRDSW